MNFPFNLDRKSDYGNWKKRKLDKLSRAGLSGCVSIKHLGALSRHEREEIGRRVCAQNFSLYETEETFSSLSQIKSALKAFGLSFGLQSLDRNLCADDDGITPLAVSGVAEREEYVPYSAKAISWHTDGYYNPPERTVRSFILHNVHPAASGGENKFLDYELIYIMLRDIEPLYIKALMQTDVMTVPENRQQGRLIRAEQSGPVFTVFDNELHMRYTARTRNIVWKNDSITSEAVACLEETLTRAGKYTHELKLTSGQGIISNNVLHARNAFCDDEKNKRLMLRARFFDSLKSWMTSNKNSIIA